MIIEPDCVIVLKKDDLVENSVKIMQKAANPTLSMEKMRFVFWNIYFSIVKIKGTIAAIEKVYAICLIQRITSTPYI